MLHSKMEEVVREDLEGLVVQIFQIFLKIFLEILVVGEAQEEVQTIEVLI